MFLHLFFLHCSFVFFCTVFLPWHFLLYFAFFFCTVFLPLHFFFAFFGLFLHCVFALAILFCIFHLCFCIALCNSSTLQFLEKNLQGANTKVIFVAARGRDHHSSSQGDEKISLAVSLRGLRIPIVGPAKEDLDFVHRLSPGYVSSARVGFGGGPIFSTELSSCFSCCLSLPK